MDGYCVIFRAICYIRIYGVVFWAIVLYLGLSVIFIFKVLYLGLLIMLEFACFCALKEPTFPSRPKGLVALMGPY